MRHRFKSAYGIDISDRHAVIVRASGRAGYETLVSKETAGIPEALRRQIATDVNGGRASSAASLASHESVLRRIAAPFSRLERALKVLPSLLDVQLPFPLEQCAHVFTSAAPNATGGLDVLAVAARHEDVQHSLQRFAEAGADPVFLDHEGLALWRQAQREMKKPDAAGRIQIHLGPAHTTLVFGSAGNLIGAHSSRMSGTGAPPAEIAARIQSWLQAQTALVISPRTEWIMSGTGASDAVRVKSLADELKISSVRVADDPTAFLARALAARALEEDDTACNLRTGQMEHPAARRREFAASTRAAVTAIVASALLIAVNIAVLIFASRRNETVQIEIQRLASELSGSPAPRGQEVLVVRRALDEKTAALLPFQRMLAPSTSKQLADILALCHANAAAVSQVSLKADSLRLDVAAANADAADRLAPALRIAGWKIQSSKRDAVIVLEGRR